MKKVYCLLVLFSALRDFPPSTPFSPSHQKPTFDNGFLVSKETVVLRRWERWKQNFGFIKRVDKGWNTTVEDLESWRLER